MVENMSKKDIEYHQIRLNILKAETKEDEKQVKLSIREYTKQWPENNQAEILWDFYGLIINKKNK